VACLPPLSLFSNGTAVNAKTALADASSNANSHELSGRPAAVSGKRPRDTHHVRREGKDACHPLRPTRERSRNHRTPIAYFLVFLES
jgi:hypothetical protein